MKILVVDNSQAMREIQRGVLAQLGNTLIQEAASGPEALDKVVSFAPDLILVDWNMPEMDGPSFVEALRRSNQHTPVVMVTARSDRAHVVRAIAAGVNNFVPKPFTPDLLSQRICETFSRIAA